MKKKRRRRRRRFKLPRRNRYVAILGIDKVPISLRMSVENHKGTVMQRDRK
jgi:hypothetical protein